MADSDLSVLHLTTSKEIFFRKQVETLQSKGIDCTVCVVPDSKQIDGDMADQRGIGSYIKYIPKVRRALKNGSYDLIHANYGLTAPFAAIQIRLPIVLTLWGSDVVGVDGYITKAFAWRADAITVRSEEMRSLLGRTDAHIIPSGVDLELFRPIDQSEAVSYVGWDSSVHNVLFPYSPSYERKNFPLAKRVVERAQEEVGASIELHSISGIEYEEMPYYYNAADALLLTSRYEGSPNTVKEALACNLPVVTTAVGDVHARLSGVEPSGIGTTETELAEELTSVLTTTQRSNGRDTVRDVSWDRIGDEIISIYESVVQSD